MKAAVSRSEGFYVVGGTMGPDAPSYVERKADQVLFDALLEGEFCYVLTARQMGKSSLMIRTASRLRERGIDISVLDLTAVGQNLTPDQWYGGLLVQIGQQVGLEEELIRFWPCHSMLGPMQRWIKAIRAVVLSQIRGRLVVFIDEIDAVRSLPFSTDEFFAGIRECYDSRTSDHEVNRLTFCLSGVATPSDLIRDTRMTPFNIGRRIELHDFSEAEAASLAGGLGREDRQATEILKRIIYWTGGHPYLTQRLCQVLAEDRIAGGDAGVERLCERLFFSARAQERDSNLLFVRERMLRSEADVPGLLDLYSRVRRNKTVRDDETNPLIGTLHLSGITRAERSRLRVRNRIYVRVFDRAWIASNLPGAEVRRRRAAYLRGVYRTAILSALMLALVGWLALTALRQRDLAVQKAAESRRLLYLSRMKVAQQEWQEANVDRVKQLLQPYIPQANDVEDLRGFEWYLFWHLTHGEVAGAKETDRVVSVRFLETTDTLLIGEVANAGSRPSEYVIKSYDMTSQQQKILLQVPGGSNFNLIVFSPDHRRAAVDGPDHDISVWDVSTGQRLFTRRGHLEAISALVFSPDGHILASGDLKGVVKLWNAESGEELRTFVGVPRRILSAAFSSDGRCIATTDESREVTFYHTTRRTRPERFHIGSKSPVSVSYFPRGKRLLVTTSDGHLYVVDVRSRRIIAQWNGHSGSIDSVAFSPDGRVFATGSADRTVSVWDAGSGVRLGNFRGHGSAVKSVAWSSDGKYIASGSHDGAIKIWDASAPSGPRFPSRHVSTYLATRFSRDDELIALGIAGASVKVWNLSSGHEIASLEEIGDQVLCGSISHDSQLLVTAGEQGIIRIWECATAKLLRELKGHASYVYSAEFSPDGKLLASGGNDNAIILWDVATGQQIGSFVSGVPNYYRAIFSPDGRILASASLDGGVKLWDVGTRTVTNSLIGHTDLVRAIAFSRDGGLLATGGADNSVRLWEVATGRELIVLGRTDFIQRVAFSSDGSRLVTGGMDGTVKLWDLKTFQELMTLHKHTGAVTSITFSNYGRDLATSGADGSVNLLRAGR